MENRGVPKLNYAVLLAAGCGTRMGHLTQNCPKCLIPVNGRPLLDYSNVVMQRSFQALSFLGIRRFLFRNRNLQ